MADNVTIDPGATPTQVIATDEVGAAQYQRFKLDVGGNGVAQPVEDGGAAGLVPCGGRTVEIEASLVRPADTTAYAAGDAVTDSTSAPVVITFTNVARANGLGGWIEAAMLSDSANQATKGQFELWVFHTSPTPDNDNAVFTPTDAECADVVAIIPFNVAYAGDATVGAGGNANYPAEGIHRPFVCQAGTRNLFGLLVVRNAYTPVSAETFVIRLIVTQD